MKEIDLQRVNSFSNLNSSQDGLIRGRNARAARIPIQDECPDKRPGTSRQVSCPIFDISSAVVVPCKCSRGSRGPVVCGTVTGSSRMQVKNAKVLHEVKALILG